MNCNNSLSSLKLNLTKFTRYSCCLRITAIFPRSVQCYSSAIESKETKNSHLVDSESSLRNLHKYFDSLDLNSYSPSLQNISSISGLVNSNETLQNLVKLGVNISRVDPAILLSYDYGLNIVPFIQRMEDLCFEKDQIARIITHFPEIVKLKNKRIQATTEYFVNHGISLEDTAKMLAFNPKIFSMTPGSIDKHLGGLQKLYFLKTAELCEIICKFPLLVTVPDYFIKSTFVTLTKFCGIEKSNCRSMVVACPRLLTSKTTLIQENYAYLTKKLKLSATDFIKWPNSLCKSHLILKERIEFLTHNDRLQLDSDKPLYTPLDSLLDCDVEEFCEKYARTSAEEFWSFIKSQ